MLDPATALIALGKTLPAIITFGRWGYKALTADGWGDPEVAAIGSLIGAVSAVHGARGVKPPPESAPIAAAQGLIVAAFTTAYGDRWAGAKKLIKRREKTVHAQIQTALDRGLETASDAELAALTGCPTRTALYRALWARFTDDDPQDPLTPLLQPDEAHAFERIFRLAWSALLTTEPARPLVRWLAGDGDTERARGLRTLLAWDTLAWRGNHVMGNVPRHAVLPHMPLEQMYVEPRLTPRDERRGRHPGEPCPPDDTPPTPLDEATHIQGWLDLWLAHGVRPALVTADFGHGKSLSARTLAARLAEGWLSGDGPVADRWMPLVVRCVDDFGSTAEPDLTRIIARAQRRQLGARGVSLDVTDPALAMPEAEQRAVIILDGLDEVRLGDRERDALFQSLCDRQCAHRRFVVFSRPSVVGAAEKVERLTHHARLASFDEAQTDAWLDRWNRGPRGDGPRIDRAGLATRNLTELAQIPVLLFMAAYTWDDKDARGLAGVYEAFFRRLAYSKFEGDPDARDGFHPEVGEAAAAVRDALVDKGYMPEGTAKVDAMLWLLGWVAWEHHRHAARERPLTRRRLHTLIEDELEPQKDTRAVVATIERGLMVILQSDLGSEDALIEYQHRSFREFLETRHWLWQLQRLDARPDEEDRLLGARLLERESRAPEFLVKMLVDVPTEARAGLVKWADGAVHSDALRACDGRGRAQPVVQLDADQRCYIREVALAVACHLSPEGFALRTQTTLARMMALFDFKNESMRVLAPRLRSPGAQLQGRRFYKADLSGADLRRAWLVHCSIDQSSFSAADLSHSNTFYGSWHYCDLTKSDLRHATAIAVSVYGGSLARARCEGSHWNGSEWEGVDLTGARMQGAHLVGVRAPEVATRGLQLTGAHLSGSTWGIVGDTEPDWSQCATRPAEVTLLGRNPGLPPDAEPAPEPTD